MTAWRLQPFEDLSPTELYEVLRLRQLVFVLEQRCLYLDTDGHDAPAFHLSGRNSGGELIAYARLFAPGVHADEAVIGRVVTHPDVRGSGIGRELMREAIAECERLFGAGTIRISAQRYLERFYRELGFAPSGEPYDEDGIPHITMLRPPAARP